MMGGNVWLTKTVWGLVILAIAAFLILPTLLVVPMSFSPGTTFQLIPEEISFRWYENFFADPRWVSATMNSLAVAATVMAISTTVGTMAAIWLDSMPGRIANAVRQLLMLPLVAPGVVIAVVVYMTFLRQGLVGTYIGYVLIHSAMAIPFVVVAVTSSLASFDHQMLKAATTLGSSPVRAAMRVQLPLITPGILSGAVFAFVISLDEVVVALFIRSASFETLPVRMFNSVTIEIDPTVAAASSMLLVLATLLIVVPRVIAPAVKKARRVLIKDL